LAAREGLIVFRKIDAKSNSRLQRANDNRVIMDSTGATIANAGVFTLTNTTSQQIQFALKLSW
jgi:hypothetical protein